jgi:hypothetical protein
MKPLSILTLLAVTATSTCVATQAAEPAPVSLTALNSMERIRQDEAPFGKPAAAISAARNEVESFQIIVAAPSKNLRIISAEASELVGPGGAKIGSPKIRVYREELVRVRRSTPGAPLPPGLYPDPLVPLINPITNQPIIAQ